MLQEKEIIESLIKVNVFTPENCSKEELLVIESSRNRIRELFYEVIKTAMEVKFWDESIKSIVITDQYYADIDKQAKEWDIPFKLTREKEYFGISKTLFNYNRKNPERIIFFPTQIINFEKKFTHLVFGQIFSVYSDRLLPTSLVVVGGLAVPLPSLSDYDKCALTEWLPINYAKQIEITVFKNYKNELDANTVFHGFCRKLKKCLFEYNSDDRDNHFRIRRFWDKTFLSFMTLITRMIEIKTVNGELGFTNEKYKNQLLAILQEVDSLTGICKVGSDISDISVIQQCVKDIFQIFEIELRETVGKKDFGIHFSKNPKDYFKGELVDTEPRFVCFIDIIGFQKMIDDYESDDSSVILQDIQEAFDQSMKVIKGREPSKYSETTKNLEYRLFSDCVSVSIPYFDNQDDFLANFNLLSVFVRGFQYVMMSKGFFTRGGISMGSYYSNENMIFSKGLVNAYLLEKEKALYPRIIVDKRIIEKLRSYDRSNIFYLNIHKYLISDWEETVFINPIIQSMDTIEQMEKWKDKIKLENEDDDEYSKLLNPLLDKAFGLISSRKEEIKLSDNDVKKTIEEHIKSNKLKLLYEKNEKDLSKYLWLEEFLTWLENDGNANLKFKYLFRQTEPEPNIAHKLIK